MNDIEVVGEFDQALETELKQILERTLGIVKSCMKRMGVQVGEYEVSIKLTSKNK